MQIITRGLSSFRDVYDFLSTLWMSDVTDRVYNTALTVETLSKIVYDRWLNYETIECIFKMLNRNSKEHLFLVAIESLLHSPKVQKICVMRSIKSYSVG